MFNIYNFAFKNKIAYTPPAQSLDYLRKVLVVITGEAQDDLVIKTSEIVLDGYPETQGILDGGLKSFDYIKMIDNDLSKIAKNLDKEYFSIAFINSPNTVSNYFIVDASSNSLKSISNTPNLGEFRGIGFYPSENIPEQNIERLAPVYKNGYDVCYTVAKFLSQTKWTNQQYESSNSIILSKVENISQAESMFTKICFWSNTEQGFLNTSLFAGGLPLVGYYIIEELNTKIESQNYKYISSKKPFKSEVVRLLLQNMAINLINQYINNGIEEDFNYQLLDTGIDYEYQSNFECSIQKPLYKITTNTIIG